MIAHDRTAKLFDRVLQIDYWRNGHVELCPQLFAVTVRAGRYFVSPAICASDGSITWRYHRVDPSLQPKSTILMLCHPRRGRSTKRRQVFWPKRSHFDRLDALPLPPTRTRRGTGRHRLRTRPAPTHNSGTGIQAASPLKLDEINGVRIRPARGLTA